MGLMIVFGGLWGAFFLFALLTFSFAYKSDSLKNYSSDRWEKWSVGFGIVAAIIFGILVIATPATLVTQYNASINLVEKYEAYDRAIQTTREMLIESDKNISVDDLNFGNIGEGLEGLKAKNSVYAMIEKREQIAREIQFRNRNVFVFFKPEPVD